MNKKANVIGTIVDDIKIMLDTSPVSKRILKHNIYEPHETKIFLNNIKADDVFIDVGAHIGYYTLAASTKINNGRIYAFEPNRESFDILKINVSWLKNNNNIFLENSALVDFSGLSKLYIDQDNAGNNKMFDDDNSKWESIQCMRLDEYLPYNKIDFVKIDTQGAEYKVLKGMENLINANKNIKMIVEFYPYGLRHMGYDPIELLSLLINFGFKMYNIKKGKIGLLHKLRCFTNKFENGKFTNLFCVKEG